MGVTGFLFLVRRKLAQDIILFITAIVTTRAGITKFTLENLSRRCK